jgi:hypothetical protein
MLINLFRLRPILLWEDDGGGAGGGSGDPAKPGNPNGDGAGGDEKRSFTQKELDALFADRAKQAKQATLADVLTELGVENLDAVKATLKAAEEAKAAQMTELEKAQKEAADLKAAKEQAEKEKADILAQAQEKLLKAAILAGAAQKGFNDPNDAWLYVDRAAIKAKDDDAFEGIEAALDAVVKAKPYLVKGQQADRKPGGTPRPPAQKPVQPPAQPEQQRPIVRL